MGGGRLEALPDPSSELEAQLVTEGEIGSEADADTQALSDVLGSSDIDAEAQALDVMLVVSELTTLGEAAGELEGVGAAVIVGGVRGIGAQASAPSALVNPAPQSEQQEAFKPPMPHLLNVPAEHGEQEAGALAYVPAGQEVAV